MNASDAIPLPRSWALSRSVSTHALEATERQSAATSAALTGSREAPTRQQVSTMSLSNSLFMGPLYACTWSARLSKRPS